MAKYATLMLAVALAAGSFPSNADEGRCDEPTEAGNVVFEFNKFRAGKLGNAFRVTVYADGTAIYEGISQVKTTGRREFPAAADRIERLVEGFTQAGFREFRPSSARGLAHATPWVSIKFCHPKINKAVTIEDPFQRSAYLRFLAVLEGVLPTKDLRCPFTIREHGIEVDACRNEDLGARLSGQANERSSLTL
jgi:hypothetical protein